MSTSIKIGSYWNNEGKYQAQYNKAWEQLIPVQGEAQDGLPEALRAISRIGYDYYNNGFCNLWQTWDGSTEMSDFYQDLVYYLRRHVPSELYSEFREWLPTVSYGSIDWGANGDDVIDRIINHIMEGIIKDELITETEAA